MSNRSFVIGDIHGCARTFSRLLDVIGLERTDTLYLLGDYIDRGPDSPGVIERILRLQSCGFDIRPVCGNHEKMLLLAIRSGGFEAHPAWFQESGVVATLENYGVSSPEQIPREHLDFMESLPLYRMTERFVFVHAGLDFSLEDPFSPAGKKAMLWSRSEMAENEKVGGRRIVTGHTPRTLEVIVKSLTGHHLEIDNGCVYGTGSPGLGHLVALNLETGCLFVQENIEE